MSQASFRALEQAGEDLVLQVYPVPAARSFLATTVLLAGLFAAPALAVLLNPARRDPWSLAAVAGGLLVCALAGWAGWQGVAGRRPHRLALGAAGIAGPAGRHPWPEIAGLAVLAPGHNRFNSGPVTAGGHALGASIAQAQQASGWSVALRLHGRRQPVLLARGLDQPTAEALCARLRAAAVPHGLAA